MIRRRNLVTGGVLGGVLGALVNPGDAEAAPQAAELSDRNVEKITAALDRLSNNFRDEREFREIGAVRSAQKLFLRTNNKFPDFLDVGMDVWFAVHDWHIRWQQQLSSGCDAQGRLTLMLDGTLIVMRTEAAANFVGLPYDNA